MIDICGRNDEKIKKVDCFKERKDKNSSAWAKGIIDTKEIILY